MTEKTITISGKNYGANDVLGAIAALAELMGGAVNIEYCTADFRRWEAHIDVDNAHRHTGQPCENAFDALYSLCTTIWWVAKPDDLHISDAY